MSENIKTKNASPFVQSVLKLDSHFTELIRLGSKIEALDMKSDFDFEQTERLITHFAQYGQGVSEEVMIMSEELTKLRSQAEEAAKLVSERAEILQARKNEQQAKMEEFRSLGEKVRELTASLNGYKIQEGDTLTDEEKARLSAKLIEFESQLLPLIEQAQNLKKEGQKSKMKILEQNADSLGQSLQAVSNKITMVRENQLLH